MGMPISGSNNAPPIVPTQQDDAKPAESTPPPRQRVEADAIADAKANHGSRQHAAEYKASGDMRSQMLKNQLESEIDPSYRNLADQMIKTGRTDPRTAAKALQATWNNMPISSSGPVGYQIAKNLTDKDLETLSRTPEGRDFLHKIENGMMDGNVESAHQAQIDRIRQAVLRQAQPARELSTALLNQATAKGPVDGPWIAKELNQEITKDLTNGARTANQVLDKALPADRARIAAELTKSLSADQLKELAKTPEGRKLIDQMSAQNIPYADLKKLASVPDGEKDPRIRSERAMKMAERMVRAAGPEDQDDAIAMLARTKKQLAADGYKHLFQQRLNDPAFQQLLGPFGLRPMEGGSNSLIQDHLKNFDAAVSNWEKMKPAEREAARNPRTPWGTMKPLPHHEPTKAEMEEKERMGRTQTIKTLPDGTTYQGPLKGLKDAEEAANIRMTKAKYDFARAGGPATLLPGRRRAAKGPGPKVVTTHQQAKYTPKSQAKSEQQSTHENVSNQPKPKVDTAKNDIGYAKTQPYTTPPKPKNVGAAKGDTVAGTGETGNAKPAVNPDTGRMKIWRGNKSYELAPLPGDNKVYTINTPKGQQKITGLEYRLRVMEAEAWVSSQHRPEIRSGVGPSQELYRQAAEQFGLDKNWWNRNFNPIMHHITFDRKDPI